jgi:hypothetical protein
MADNNVLSSNEDTQFDDSEAPYLIFPHLTLPYLISVLSSPFSLMHVMIALTTALTVLHCTVLCYATLRYPELLCPISVTCWWSCKHVTLNTWYPIRLVCVSSL